LSYRGSALGRDGL